MKGLIRRIVRATGYDIVPRSLLGSDRYLDQTEFQYILWLDRIYQKIARVPGNLVEIGVARGRNAILFGHFIRLSGDAATRRYYGFDTFRGFAERDLTAESGLDPGRWKDIRRQEIEERIAATGLAGISYVYEGDVRERAEGFVGTAGPNFQARAFRAALLYIDCNAYEPALYAMRFFRPFMSPGALVCIDEKKQGGETRALADFARGEGLRVEKDPGPFALPAYVRIP